MIKGATLILLTILLLGCTESEEQIIPNVSFSGTLNMMQADYNSKNSFTTRVDMSGRPLGFAGVVVYRLTKDTYYVYDQICPYEKSVGSLVIIPKGESDKVRCPTCGSEFLLSGGYGDVIKGPSKHQLKVYQNRYEPGNDYLSIWN